MTLTSSENTTTPFQQLYDISYSSLMKNVIHLESGPYLCAGGHQFHSLWTRDFAYAAWGLLAAGHHRVVQNHIRRLLQATYSPEAPRPALIPRMLDSSPSWPRVLKHTVGKGVFPPFVREKQEDPLNPEFEGERGTKAMDSNTLIIITAYKLFQTIESSQIEQKWEKDLLGLVDYYEDKFNSRGLLRQGNYTDWQDSAKRTGATFYVNFLYWKALKCLLALYPEKARARGLENKAQNIQQSLLDQFWRPRLGLFQAHESEELFALEDQLFVLLDDAFFTEEEKRKLYQKLRVHPLWKMFRIPGNPTYPYYPKKWISPANRFVGLLHYHDRFLWSWLIGLSGLVANKMEGPKESKRIFETYQSMAIRDGVIGEIYEPEDTLPMVKNVFYHSETPFSWGAGITLFALHHCQWND